MPPKGKKNKKQDEDWEAEALGDTADPIAAATADAKAGDAAQDEEEGGGGGLLAALKKNKGKRAKKGKSTNDFVQGEDVANGETDSPAPEPAAPVEATADDIFAEPTSGKGNKGKQAKATPKEEADDDDDAGDGRVKTKKEKEKEKKEREKQRKKEQAAKKKATGPTKAEEHEEKVEAAPEKIAAPEPAAAIGKDGKKKKLPAHLAALQRQMEERRLQEEEDAKLRKAQQEAEREAQRLDEEQAAKEAEARERKKQKEKEKKEELKKQGLLLTKAQKEAKAKAEQARETMLAAGMKVAGLEEEPVEKKKPVYETKKKGKGPSKAEEEAKRLEEAKKAAEAEAERLARQREQERETEKLKAAQMAADKAAALSEPEDDWEKAAEAEEQDDVKDSWDADTDEEEAAAKAIPKDTLKANGKTPAKAEANGTATKSAGAKQEKQLAIRSSKAAASSSEEDSSSEEEEVQTSTAREAARKKAEAAARREKQKQDAIAAASKDDLRSPICCILGHVDTGKTKLLDKIRQTNVQEGEAGGITQQIGATFFPVEALEQKTAVVNKDGKFKFNIPGLLVIDTPGHESFTNLRSRGSSLCNIAILVVDIMHGLEPQTLESMRLLRDRKTPFIVALNKIDRLYGWKRIDNNGFQDSLALQNKAVQQEFRNRLDQTKVAFAEQGFNSELFYENKSMAKNVSLVPTSAHTGEGIPDMIKLITQLTQERMTSGLMYLSEVECTVLEVKVIEGLGTTIDVVLSNGVLREGDRIVLCGLNGPISTNIRALLTPAPLKELRVKSAYVHNQEVKASLGVKIAANDLEHAIAGSRLLVVGPNDDEEDLEEEVMSDIENLLSRVSKTGRGVSVQASTLGSLEALLEFLKVSKIPVANISIGPVYKRDVMQCGVMLEKHKEYAVMLCFDVKVDPAAAAYAQDVGVKIFEADIIYHLFDNFSAHMAQLAEQRKEESKMLAVFPCVLKTVAVFNNKDPIVVGVDVIEGNLRPLTPIAVVKNNPITNVKEIIALGRVTSIERDHKQVPICKRGQPSVAVKIEGPNQPMYGRQLEESDNLYSSLSRRSIDTLKEFFRPDVSNEEWALIKKMKPLFDIP